MTHHYGQPILVTTTADGQPATFTWRDHVYPIVEILATWHLQDRWWQQGRTPATQPDQPDHPDQAVPTESDRTYFRVRCVGECYGELYYDAAHDRWVLDRIYD